MSIGLGAGARSPHAHTTNMDDLGFIGLAREAFVGTMGQELGYTAVFVGDLLATSVMISGFWLVISLIAWVAGVAQWGFGPFVISTLTLSVLMYITMYITSCCREQAALELYHPEPCACRHTPVLDV